MRVAVLLLLVVLAGAGFFGGTLLLADPDGSALGLRLDQLPDWYGSDYRWAGLLLFGGFGIAPGVAAVMLARRNPGGWRLVGSIGIGLLAWMLVQIVMIGLILPPMQLTFVVLGVVLAGTSVGADRQRRAHPPTRGR